MRHDLAGLHLAGHETEALERTLPHMARCYVCGEVIYYDSQKGIICDTRDGAFVRHQCEGPEPRKEERRIAKCLCCDKPITKIGTFFDTGKGAFYLCPECIATPPEQRKDEPNG